VQDKQHCTLLTACLACFHNLRSSTRLFSAETTHQSVCNTLGHNGFATAASEAQHPTRCSARAARTPSDALKASAQTTVLVGLNTNPPNPRCHQSNHHSEHQAGSVVASLRLGLMQHNHLSVTSCVISPHS